MPNEFKIRNGLVVEGGSTTITGSLIVTGGITGSLSGGGSAFPFTGSANITGSLGVIGPSTFSGSVGIADNLTLSTGGFIYGNTTNPYIQLNNSLGSKLGFGSDSYVDVGGPTTIVNANTNVIRFRNNRIVATQNTIIGTSDINDTPTARLQVRGSGATSSTTSLRIENSNTTASLLVRDDGWVGIGTATPTTQLEVFSGSEGGTIKVSNSTYSSYWTQGNSFTTTLGFSNSGKILWNTNTMDFVGSGVTYRIENGAILTNSVSGSFLAGRLGTLGFQTYGSTTRYNAIGNVYTDNSTSGLALFYKSASVDIEGMRLTSIGRVGIGTTNPNYLFDVNGQGRFNNSGGGYTIIGNTSANATAIDITGFFTSAGAIRITNSNNGATASIGDYFNTFNTYGTITRTSGTDNINQIGIAPTYNFSNTYVGTLRGIYYNPALTSMTGVTHRAIETTSGDILFQSGSTPLFFVSGSGNVGIGITNPTASLDVFRNNTGNIQNNNDSVIVRGNNPRLKILGTAAGNSTGDGVIQFSTGDGGDRWVITAGQTFSIGAGWYNSNTSLFRIPNLTGGNTAASVFLANADSDGRFSLGFSGTNGTPLSGFTGTGRLFISSTGLATPSAMLQVRGAGATSSTTALLVQNSNASASLVVRDDSNVGIGTASPVTRLHVSASGNVTIGRFETPGGTGRVQVSALYENIFRAGSDTDNTDFWYDGGFATTYIDNNYPGVGASFNQYGDIRFRRKLDGTNLSTVMTIRGNNGDIGIGTTTPAAKLHISGASSTTLFEIDSPTLNNILFVSGSGRIGIGTNIPLYQLHVSGSGVVYASNRFIGAGGVAADPTFATISTIAGIFEPAYANLGFSSYGGEAGRIEGASRLWNIGMTGGTARFNIRGTGATSDTTALLIQNSTPSGILTVLGDGSVTSDLVTSTSAFNVRRIGTPTTRLISLMANGGIRAQSFWGETGANANGDDGVWSFQSRNRRAADSGSVSGMLLQQEFVQEQFGQVAFNALKIIPTIATSNTANNLTIRGLYYEPFLNTTTGVTAHRAIETTAGDVLFRNGSSTLFFVSGSGRVGIGTTTPTFNLDVSGSGRFTDNLTVTGSVTATTGFTGSLFGTASFATQALSASWAPSTGGGSAFPFTGNALISGSLTLIGNQTITGSLSQGLNAEASGVGSHAEGEGTFALGNYSHAEGLSSTTPGFYAHAEGNNNTAWGQSSHAEGSNTYAYGDYSHTEGAQTIASGSYSHAEGQLTTSSGSYSHAEGESTLTIGQSSHAEGANTITEGNYSHAEGNSTQAFGTFSHAEGINTQTIGEASHAEGNNTIAFGNYSHAEGESTVAFGNYSHAEGEGTIASGSAQTVMGRFNTRGNNTSLVVIGNGSNDSNRSNLVLFNQNNVVVSSSLNVTSGITGSLFGTASFALSASWAPSTGGGASFPFTGSAIISGSLIVTGSISNNVLSGSDSRVLVATSTGTLEATNQVIIQTYIDPNGTEASLLNTTSNWNVSGSYIGTTITGTYQGQKHYNTTYFFEAVDDNVWIRLLRV